MTNAGPPFTCRCCGHSAAAVLELDGRDRWQGVPGRFSVRVCERCEAGTTFPLLEEHELGALYPAAYSPYVPLEGGVTGAVWGYLLERSMRAEPTRSIGDRSPARLLDVGCGRGDVPAKLIERGWKASGIDPSEDACEVARSRGIDAHVGTLSTVELAGESFEALTMNHSLEHLVDPPADLRRAYDLLTPGGIIGIALPNFGCWQRKRFGGRWFHLDLPRHRVHFNPAALRDLLERTGFVNVRTGTQTSAVGLPASVQYAVAGRCLFPRGLGLKLATGFAYLVSPLTRVLDRSAGGGDVLWATAERPTA